MKKNYLCIPDGHFFTLSELQERLKFHFLAHNHFETEEDRLEIQRGGLEKFKQGAVAAESLELGKRFIDKIEASYIPEASIRWRGESIGYGLFAEEPLEAGSYVGEYTGIVRKNDRRYFEPLNHYCFEYPVPDDIGRSHVIDATSGHLTRFINHSYQPNLRHVHVFFNGFYHLIFLAINPIEKGTELTFNYGPNYWCLRGKPVDF
jgi:uncharacterized protein